MAVSPAAGGQLAESMIPSQYQNISQFIAINPSDYGGSQVGPDTSSGELYVDPSWVKVGTVNITQNWADAASQALQNAAISSANGNGGYPPGYVASEFSGPSNYSNEEMQGRSEAVANATDELELIGSGAGFIASTYQLSQSAGQVDVYYDPNSDVYRYSVSQNQPGQNGWSNRPISQANQFFIDVRSGMH
jgi:hypothetical protein